MLVKPVVAQVVHGGLQITGFITVCQGFPRCCQVRFNMRFNMVYPGSLNQGLKSDSENRGVEPLVRSIGI